MCVRMYSMVVGLLFSALSTIVNRSAPTRHITTIITLTSWHDTTPQPPPHLYSATTRHWNTARSSPPALSTSPSSYVNPMFVTWDE